MEKYKKRSQIKKTLRLGFWILLFLSIFVDSSSAGQGRIVGGEPANITDFPYQLALEDVGGWIVCGASIVHRYWALTAAHCIDGYPADALCLRSGSSFRLRGGTLHYVAKTFMHPKYNAETTDYDVAVVQVINRFHYSDVAQRIPMANRAPSEGTPAVVSGWGYLQFQGNVPVQLQQVMVYIENYDECNEKYSNQLTPRMMCATVPGGTKDACQGDSGGPLAFNKTLVGIVSWGEGCANKDYPGVYTNVAMVYKWVIYVIRRNTQPFRIRKA